MSAPRFTFLKAYFKPGREIVTLAVVARDGVFKGRAEDLYTSQAALSARSGREGYWSDAEVFAEAQHLLEQLGAVLVDECEHDVPIDEACERCELAKGLAAPVAVDVAQGG